MGSRAAVYKVLATPRTSRMTGQRRQVKARTAVIIGGGDHARVIADVVRTMGLDVIGFIEPNDADVELPKRLDGLRCLGGMAELVPNLADGFVVAIGDNRVRAEIFQRSVQSGLPPIPAVHPSSVVLPGAMIAPGAQVCAGTVIGLGAQIHANAIVNTAVSVDHDDVVGAHASVGPGAHLAGHVSVGVGAHVGIGAAVREGIRIGEWAFVAAGAVVVRDVPDLERVAGVPARVMTTGATK